MKILYKGILKAFAAEAELYKNNDEKSLFRQIKARPPAYIDLYDSQPEIPDQFEFMCPAIFVDYSIAWQKNGGMRIGTMTVDVHVLTDANENTSNISKLPDDGKSIDYYEIVVDILEGIATEETSQLILANEQPITTDYFNYHMLTFECTISRRINSTRKYVDGVIEDIPIAGAIKKKYTFDM